MSRLVLSLVVAGFLPLFTPAVGAAQERFACTEVLGFSQSFQWYGGRGSGRVGGLPGDFLPGWQGRFTGGAAVELWADPDYLGWTGTSMTPDGCALTAVDRVVFNVSGAARSVEQWRSDIEAVVRLIRQKYPGVRRIVLMPVVGAPEGQCQNVRAASNHPVIVSAIRQVAGAGIAEAGAAPVVADCAAFADALGHLTPASSASVKEELQQYYRNR